DPQPGELRALESRERLGFGSTGDRFESLRIARHVATLDRIAMQAEGQVAVRLPGALRQTAHAALEEAQRRVPSHRRAGASAGFALERSEGDGVFVRVDAIGPAFELLDDREERFVPMLAVEQRFADALMGGAPLLG